MKIVKMKGGLGNQMFQYAFGLALSKKYHSNVYYDLSHYEEHKGIINGVSMHTYLLENFNVTIETAPKNICSEYTRSKKTKIPKFLRKLFNIKKYYQPHYIQETCSVKFEEKLINQKKEGYFDGHYISEKYFKNHRKDILDAFELKTKLSKENEEVLNQIKSCEAVSLHVRRGDYLNLQNIYTICDFTYYQKAITNILEKVPNAHFFLFSNDIPWVLENLKLTAPHKVVDINDDNTAYFDLTLMKHCKHNIIANSTFSWWGAWLNNNLNKIVITPEQWFKIDEYKNNDILPDEWIKL